MATSRTIILAIVAVASWQASTQARDAAFDDLMDRVSQRVVRLYGVKAGLSAGYSSGVLVSGDGLVVTVDSLLLDAQHLRVVTSGGTEFGADVIGRDNKLQLALLKLKPEPHYDHRGRRVTPDPITSESFAYFEPGDSHAVIPGDWVLAAGNPFKVAVGAEPVSVTIGVFSTRTNLDAKRKTRDFPYRGEVLVIDAITSNPGAPGGALVTLDGSWIGLIGRVVKSNLTHTNFNYAIPSEVVTQFVDEVLHPETARSKTDRDAAEPYHGIKLFELGYRKKLVYVERTKRASPARLAGLKKDDLIVSVAGRSVTDIDAFNEIIKSKSPGDRIELVVIRNDKIKNLTLELGERK